LEVIHLRNQTAEQAAIAAAGHLTVQLKIHEPAEVGVILGTGWGNKLALTDERSLPFSEVPGFGELQTLEGHARKFVAGTCGGKSVMVLSGRVHINEAPADPQIHEMVRLQTETLMQLGIRKLIVTCAAGALPDSGVQTGDLVVIDGFMSLFAPDMPLYAGEFCSPDDALCPELREMAFNRTPHEGFDTVTAAGYAMVRGPFFEGRKYDKLALAKAGASIVGMSTLPEACIAALYGAKVLALAFITNDSVETHSHQTNLERARKASDGLGGYLQRIIEQI
jgi:purine-nucleoside phosphorylase